MVGIIIGGIDLFNGLSVFDSTLSIAGIKIKPDTTLYKITENHFSVAPYLYTLTDGSSVSTCMMMQKLSDSGCNIIINISKSTSKIQNILASDSSIKLIELVDSSISKTVDNDLVDLLGLPVVSSQYPESQFLLINTSMEDLPTLDKILVSKLDRILEVEREVYGEEDNLPSLAKSFEKVRVSIGNNVTSVMTEESLKEN